MENHEIVCCCSNVTKGQILEAMGNGARTMNDVCRMTGACTNANCKEKSPRGACYMPWIKAVMFEHLQNHKN